MTQPLSGTSNIENLSSPVTGKIPEYNFSLVSRALDKGAKKYCDLRLEDPAAFAEVEKLMQFVGKTIEISSDPTLLSYEDLSYRKSQILWKAGHLFFRNIAGNPDAEERTKMLQWRVDELLDSSNPPSNEAMIAELGALTELSPDEVVLRVKTSEALYEKKIQDAAQEKIKSLNI